MSLDLDYLKQLTLLVVEDEPIVRRLLVRMVQNLGVANVHEAADGGEALHKVKQTEPDVILCDVNMEPMNGIAFVEALRSLDYPALREIPVLFLTADVAMDTLSEAMRLQIGGYLVKPVTQENLVHQLGQVLAGDE